MLFFELSVFFYDPCVAFLLLFSILDDGQTEHDHRADTKRGGKGACNNEKRPIGRLVIVIGYDLVSVDSDFFYIFFERKDQILVVFYGSAGPREQKIIELGTRVFSRKVVFFSILCKDIVIG